MYALIKIKGGIKKVSKGVSGSILKGQAVGRIFELKAI